MPDPEAGAAAVAAIVRAADSARHCRADPVRRRNAASYWTDVLASLRGSLAEIGPTGTLPSAVVEWCLLGACRMLYTATTADVASKSAVGAWAAEAIGGVHADAIHAAVRLRREPERPVGRDLLRSTADAMADVLARIRSTR